MRACQRCALTTRYTWFCLCRAGSSIPSSRPPTVPPRNSASPKFAGDASTSQDVEAISYDKLRKIEAHIKTLRNTVMLACIGIFAWLIVSMNLPLSIAISRKPGTLPILGRQSAPTGSLTATEDKNRGMRSFFRWFARSGPSTFRSKTFPYACV